MSPPLHDEVGSAPPNFIKPLGQPSRIIRSCKRKTLFQYACLISHKNGLLNRRLVFAALQALGQQFPPSFIGQVVEKLCTLDPGQHPLIKTESSYRCTSRVVRSSDQPEWASLGQVGNASVSVEEVLKAYARQAFPPPKGSYM